MGEKQGGQLVAEALLEKRVRCVFTLSGGHITPIYQYLENSPITLVDTRHEQAAVFMAEAMGRMTRQPAVALVTAGPGFTNSLSAIANASFSNTPPVFRILPQHPAGAGSGVRLGANHLYQRDDGSDDRESRQCRACQPGCLQSLRDHLPGLPLGP